MNMIEGTLASSNGGYAVEAGGQRINLDEETLSGRPALTRFEGRKVVLGIRPEDLEDAALAGDVPQDRRLKGKVELTEALGSEIMAHFTVDAPPALTEDVRELARDVGQEAPVQAPVADSEDEAVMVGRFGPRSRIKNGDTVDVAVETGALHFFDLETGLGIYSDTQSPSNGKGAQE
jgi:multiple sugar transport system ATP-binding protein